jgi:DNA-directed RNA polymerase subunit beta'
LLNRAPTLHRLGIQAFEPKLVDGKAIQLHPLVCKAFNADFDGDQMAVHIPLSAHAQAEARILMLSTHNLFSPADGSPIVSPQQDIILGNYFLTMDKPFLTVADGLTETDIGRVIVKDIKDNEGNLIIASGKRLSPDALPLIKKAGGEVHLGANAVYSSPEDAIQAYYAGGVELHEYVAVRLPKKLADGTIEKTMVAITPGRVIFNEIMPEEIRWSNEIMDKKTITRTISQVYLHCGTERTVLFLDALKSNGFRWATKGGTTFAMTDMQSPPIREEILARTEADVEGVNKMFRRGAMDIAGRRRAVLELWTKATAEIGDEIVKHVDRFNPIAIMTESGARGSKKQISQLSGMRGLMADPFGNIIEDLPVKSNFHEGLSVLEYFVTTHGTRKGLADTALRTADAGYLTRRLVDVAQDVIIRERDCGTEHGIYVSEFKEGEGVIEALHERVNGRTVLEDIYDMATGELIINKGEMVNPEIAGKIGKSGHKRVGLRSVLTCESRQGVCATCYGRDLAVGKQVDIGVAVGIIAAQSIGEPGTQLTMRTFHTGGVASANSLTGVIRSKNQKNQNLETLYRDRESNTISLGGEEASEREQRKIVTSLLKVAEDQVGGLLRVVELFESRKPKGQAIVTEFEGEVIDVALTSGLRNVVISAKIKVTDDLKTIKNQVAAVDISIDGEVLVPAGTEIAEKFAKKIRDAGTETVQIRKEVLVPYRGDIRVKKGDYVYSGDRLTDGPLDPQRVLELQGLRGVQEYMTREVQQVYKQQGVDINDKHVEIIVRQMLKKRRVIDPGNTTYLQGQTIDRFELEDANRQIEARDTPGKPATSVPVLLGITEASLATDSFLSAASFQKTTRVLTEAAVRGKKDHLVGLKENVIIGRLIPAGTGLAQYRALEVTSADGRALDTGLNKRAALLAVEVPAEDLAALDSQGAAAKIQLEGAAEEVESLDLPDTLE